MRSGRDRRVGADPTAKPSAAAPSARWSAWRGRPRRKRLTEALAAPTDSGSVARLLADDAAGAARKHLDPLAGAIARGAEARARLAEAAGGLLAADTVGRLLGITRQAVDKRRGAGRLLALRIRGDWHYPAAQSPGMARCSTASPR